MKTLATDCLIEAAQDPSLPYTAYLVEYVAPDGHTKYDIVMCIKQSEIFDAYYDKYGKAGPQRGISAAMMALSAGFLLLTLPVM